jgi:hypothetical protein
MQPAACAIIYCIQSTTTYYDIGANTCLGYTRKHLRGLTTLLSGLNGVDLAVSELSLGTAARVS